MNKVARTKLGVYNIYQDTKPPRGIIIKIIKFHIFEIMYVLFIKKNSTQTL